MSSQHIAGDTKFARAMINTARETIFSFSRRPEKMVFPKKSRWNMIFLVLSGKIIFLKKIHGNMTSNFLERWYFQKGPLRHDLSCIIWKDGILFFPKTWYFFLGQKVRDDLPQEIHGNMIFSVHTYGCYKRGATLLGQKKSKMVQCRKNTPKHDWCSRLTS